MDDHRSDPLRRRPAGWHRMAVELFALIGIILVIVAMDATPVDWSRLAGRTTDVPPPARLWLAAAASLGVAVIVWLRSRRLRRPAWSPIPQLSGWMIAAGLLVVAVLLGVSTWYLLGQAAGAPIETRASIRLEAIRTALSVGAVAAGCIVLVLTARRQWLSERTQVHQERVAQSAEHDAQERRGTESYAKAVEQLGNDRAAVRLGGLYALDRLTRSDQSYRRTGLEVVCAYLRMPFDAEALQSAATEDDEKLQGLREELQVRLTAQRIMSAAVQRWPSQSVDLTGAVLVDFELADCIVMRARFNGALFFGPATFRSVRFILLPGFEDATFDSSVSFAGCSNYDLGGARVRKDHDWSRWSSTPKLVASTDPDDDYVTIAPRLRTEDHTDLEAILQDVEETYTTSSRWREFLTRVVAARD